MKRIKSEERKNVFRNETIDNFLRNSKSHYEFRFGGEQKYNNHTTREKKLIENTKYILMEIEKALCF